MKLFLPPDVERVVPSWFADALRATDPNLMVYFNPQRKRWTIDRCTRGGVHNAGAHVHTNECPRTNVRVVQDQGQYMPLCQAVIDDLRGSDAWAQHGSVSQFMLTSDNAAADDVAKRKRQIDALYSEATRDNRRQLLRAYHLFQQHDTARVNQ
jgi:hypothetical protein